MPLTQAPYYYLYSEAPFIAWGDDRYGIFRFRGYSNSSRFGVVDRFGRWMTPEIDGGFTSSSSRQGAAIAWNGSAFGVAWLADLFTVAVTLFGPDSTRLGPDATFAASEPVDHPAIIADGDGFAISWEALTYLSGEENSTWRNDVLFSRIGPDGVPIGTPTVVHSSFGSGQTAYPALVVTDDEFLLVLSQDGSFRLAVLDESGSLLQAPAPLDTSPACVGGPATLALTSDEVGFAWACGQQIWFMRLNQQGEPLATPTAVVPSSTTTSAPSLSWSGVAYNLAYREGTSPNYRACAQRLDPNGTPAGPPACMSTTAGPWGRVSFASAGAETAAVFLQPQNGTSEVYFARFGCSCSDLDEDGVSTCQDCDDADAAIFPGAPQVCDGRDNDCRRPLWPDAPGDESDADGDGHPPCGGDCNDASPVIHPMALERCNDIDDDCDGLFDEDGDGMDSDQDGVRNLCDNCRFAQNPSQVDGDDDGHGDPCDNCATVRNSSQTDFNADSEGDDCDLDDGLILVKVPAADRVRWQAESGFTGFNVYRGNLNAMVSLGYYTQDPGSNALAARFCDATSNPLIDGAVVQSGEVAMYLVTGVAGGQEYGLGQDGFGYERPNDFPCP